jgi:hypothetical protein
LGFTAIVGSPFSLRWSVSSVQTGATRSVCGAGTTAPFSAPLGTIVGTAGRSESVPVARNAATSIAVVWSCRPPAMILAAVVAGIQAGGSRCQIDRELWDSVLGQEAG